MHRTATFTVLVRSLCAAAVLAGCAAVQAQGTEPASAGPALGAMSREALDARFREAMRLHRAGRYSAAYGRFIALADTGHLPATRVALEMLRNGRTVYGTDWSAAPSQVVAWERTLGTQGTIDVATLGE
jgi:hypothetical protein